MQVMNVLCMCYLCVIYVCGAYVIQTAEVWKVGHMSIAQTVSLGESHGACSLRHSSWAARYFLAIALGGLGWEIAASNGKRQAGL